MENTKLRNFAVTFGIAIFLVILLAVTRLFRVALLTFAVSGVIFFVWGFFLAKEDDELKQKASKKEKLPKPKSDLQKKLLKQVGLAKDEIDARKQSITALEEKSVYFIRKVYGDFVAANEEGREVFLSYEKIKASHGSIVAPHLKENCEKIIVQHRAEIDFLSSEIYYWQTVEKKYTIAFEEIAESQKKMAELQRLLKKKERKAAKDEALNKEMQEYLETNLDKDHDGLKHAVYQNMHYTDVRNEVQNQLSDLEETMQRTSDQIENLDALTQNYHSLRNEMGTMSAAIENDLAEEIRRLSKQLQEL